MKQESNRYKDTLTKVEINTDKITVGKSRESVSQGDRAEQRSGHMNGGGEKRLDHANPYKQPPGSLAVQIQGPRVQPGRILLADLHTITDALNTSLERFVMRRIEGVRSLRPGERGRPAREYLQLYLSDVRRGSAVMEFQLAEEQCLLEAKKTGTDLLIEFIDGINSIQDGKKPIPEGFDRGVLQGINMMKAVFNRGIDEIKFIARGATESVKSSYNPSTGRRIDTLLLRPAKNQRSLSGIILEADFSSPELRFELFTKDGEAIPCIAPEEDLSAVLGGVMQYVRITGDAEEDPETGRISKLRADNIEFVSGTELVKLPYGSIKEFWAGIDLEALVERQGIMPFNPEETPDWEVPTDDEIERYFKAIKREEHKAKRIEN